MKTKFKIFAITSTCYLLFISTWLLIVHNRQRQLADTNEPQLNKKTNYEDESKAVAEYLVGTWTLIDANGTAIPTYCEITFEFTAAGTLTIRRNLEKSPSDSIVLSGTYRLNGKTLELTSPIEEEGRPVRTRYVTIESISESELITSTEMGEGKLKPNVYKRINPK